MSDLRSDYRKHQFLEEDALSDPIQQFQLWFDDAQRAGVVEPNAFTLATIDKDGFPSARILLLKGVENSQFVFFTNYDSDKGKQIIYNPNVALCFLWLGTERQVRIVGKASKVSRNVTENYFHSRPRESQIGAWVSNQSSTLKSREQLDDQMIVVSKQFENEDTVPLPPHWGGFQVEPHSIEFWQGRPNRLHDRLRYKRDGQNWKIERLAP